MGVFIHNDITDRGRILLGDAQVGATFEATKIVMGSGYIPSGHTARTMTAVVAPVIELAINKARRAGDGTVTFGGMFSNETITEAFYFREFALYARVKRADGTYSDEVCYSYGNAGDNADLLPAYAAGAVVEKQMDLVTYIGNDTEVNLTIESGIFTAHAWEHASDGSDPLTPAMIGAVALENKSLQFTNYGLAGVNIDVVFNHNYCVGISEDGYGTRPPNSGWVNVVNFTNYHFTAQIAVSCTLGEEKDRPVKMWVREKYSGETSGWSDWKEIANAEDFLPLTGGTLHGSLSVNHGSGTFLSWINDEETGASINAFKGDITTRLEAIANANGGGAFLSVFKDGQWTVREIYHEGNAPYEVATAELI